jgi:hypothetical protein
MALNTIFVFTRENFNDISCVFLSGTYQLVTVAYERCEKNFKKLGFRNQSLTGLSYLRIWQSFRNQSLTGPSYSTLDRPFVSFSQGFRKKIWQGFRIENLTGLSYWKFDRAFVLKIWQGFRIILQGWAKSSRSHYHPPSSVSDRELFAQPWNHLLMNFIELSYHSHRITIRRLCQISNTKALPNFNTKALSNFQYESPLKIFSKALSNFQYESPIKNSWQGFRISKAMKILRYELIHPLFIFNESYLVNHRWILHSFSRV